MGNVMQARFFRKLFRAPSIAVAALLLGACAPMFTQSPNQGWRPVNVKNVDGAERLLLDGYDVVGMHLENQARPGDAKLRSLYKGVTLFFSSAEHKAKFDASPEAYLPKYGGYCSNGMLAFLSMFTTFGTPQDITLAPLRVELLFAADEATGAVIRANA
jgi:YHS domain-containing protein